MADVAPTRTLLQHAREDLHCSRIKEACADAAGDGEMPWFAMRLLHAWLREVAVDLYLKPAHRRLQHPHCPASGTSIASMTGNSSVNRLSEQIDMMISLANTLSPTITDMIRLDHTHVLTTFHQYEIDTNAGTKQALVNTVCLALEIHAQLEEEIFYPAMRSVGAESAVLDKSVPEHGEMRRLIARLRSMKPADAGYDQTFMELMRNVMHHVADEETTLLPDAERVLADRLSELGAQMTKRRLQLAAPRAGRIAVNTLRGFPASSMLVAAGVVLAGTYFARRALARHP